jgi:hypothetical protein
VLTRVDGSLEAYFSYDNPLSFRAFAAGTRNHVLRNDAEWLDARQPTELASGVVTNAFNRPIAMGEGDTLVWSLDGASALASADSELCSGRELARLPFAPQAVLFGAQEVVLGDYTSVTAPSDLASVVSGGDLVIGASSVVGHALAGARTTLAEHALVMGTAVTREGLTAASTASVGAAKELQVPSHVLEWAVDFGAVLESGVTVRPRERQALSPGDYGDVVVAAQAELVLGPGTYRFRSLRVDGQSSLQIGGGDVVLHVAAGLDLLGETDVAGDAGLFIGYFGSAAATIAGSLHATVVAPHASLTLGTLRNSVYTGAFYGRRLDVRASTLVQFRER